MVARKKQKISTDEVDSRPKSRPPLPLPPVEAEEEEEDEEIADATSTAAVSRDVDGLTISHVRSKSAPAMHHKNNNHRSPSTGNGSEALSCANGNYEEEDDESDEEMKDEPQEVRPQFVKSKEQKQNLRNNIKPSCRSSEKHVYDIPEGDDYMAIYETIDRKSDASRREQMMKSHSMEALETPTHSVKGDDDTEVEDAYQRHPKRRHRSSKSKCQRHEICQCKRRSYHEHCTTNSQTAQPQTHPKNRNGNDAENYDLTDGSMASFLRKALRMEGPQLQQRTITIKKTIRESLGMRIGGGIGSNEGDTPIYIANIHPHGCIGKSKQLKVRFSRSVGH